MHTIYTFARIYPYVALALAIILFELGIYFHRRMSKLRFFVWALTVLVVIGIILWLVFRGDINSDKWVDELVNMF